MTKVFNVNGACRPDRHYMVDLGSRIEGIRSMIDAGDYFTINRARQYGKTTVLQMLAVNLRDSYMVVSLDFQRMSSADFADESSFVRGLSREIAKKVRRMNGVSCEVKEHLLQLAERKDSTIPMAVLFDCFNEWCEESELPVVLIIDEADSASDNQIFLDFLAQLRAAYLDREESPTFQSVILAGVYDVRGMKRKIRSEEEHKENSPWNIAADFEVDMSFSADDIAGMLKTYEEDYHTGMDIRRLAQLIYNYTSGYPYLVSRLCKIIDEKISECDEFFGRRKAWSEHGFYEAEKMIEKEDNTLYQSLIRRLKLYPELRTILYELLFTGKQIPYVATNDYLKDATMFGFVRNEKDTAVISNRIFEAVLYNYFISEEFASSKMYDMGMRDKNQFVVGGHLNVRRILEKFIETFEELYGNENEKFLENVGRRYFILFLKPIINGVGNYSIEPQTRNSERMDLVIYYHGDQHILELKIWRGNTYNQRGEEQLSAYLDYFHMKKGYMLSFNFNKRKKTGIHEIVLGDKMLIEAVV
ncbi:MAG: AAA-like domain-containing protein [Clostridiales bacterium]|nr:AAA-like domain-containing protein [Clostridiales bacterium]